MTKFVFLWIAFVVLVSSCSNDARNENVLALVNGKPIHKSFFEGEISKIHEVPGVSIRKGSERAAFLNELIYLELLFQDAIESGSIDSSMALKRDIARHHLEQLVAQKFSEPTEAELKKEFERRKKELEQVRAAHILIRPKSSSEKDKAQAKETIARISDRIKNGEDFSTLAKEFSQDQANRAQGGDLGFQTRDKFVPSFSNAVFLLQSIGEVSSIIETQFGFHIAKLIDHKREFDNFKDVIKRDFVKARQEAVAKEIFSKLQSSASIRTFPERLVPEGKAKP